MILACGVGVGCASAHVRVNADVTRSPPANFELDGRAFCFAGANNYYLAHTPRPMVDDVLESAQAMGVRVVRTWAFIDRGSLDGTVPNIDGDGTKRGFWFQGWDAAQKRAIYNDGPDGLGGLDYALAKAGQLGLKLVLVLTNNWHAFGGMDQYLSWYGLSEHSDFYRDARVRRAYESWLLHLTSHVNGITKLAYRDDPTIFAWELANEPRGTSGTPSDVITRWAGEMSSYLKSVDGNHLVAVGDEGFLAGASEHWTYHADNGVDHPALTALPNVDYGTFHLYPDLWDAGFAWSERWIDDHLRVARQLGKPTVLEEYGLEVTRDHQEQISEGLPARLEGYSAWNERVLSHGGNATMFWLLIGRSETGALYPDFDRFGVYRGDETADLLSRFAERFSQAAPACAASAVTSAAPSHFVRVQRATAAAH
jgi:mannan endo-1,4-beta-mannosidase